MPTNQPTPQRWLPAPRPLGWLLATLLGTASLITITSSPHARATPHLAAAKAGRGAQASSPTQVTAHDGRFWQGSVPVTFHGARVQPLELGPTKTAANIARDASWGMNFLRMHIHWADLEPNPPVKQPNGSWSHTYNTAVIQEFKDAINIAASYHMWVLVTSSGDGAASFFAYPMWLFQAPYNSHGITYPQTVDGNLAAQANLWSDTLQQQFWSDFWSYVSSQIKGSQYVFGYELMNEPQTGSIPDSKSITQTVLDTELKWAKAVRAVDPNRIVMFTTRGGYAAGIGEADYGHWVTPPPADPSGLPQPLGIPDVAFDVHDYFGGRWGVGMDMNPSSTSYLEGYQDLYMNVLNGLGDAVGPPYIGSTGPQIRWIQYRLDSLNPWKIPLLVGEFGCPYTDPGAELFFGTVVSALQYEKVSWSVSGSVNGIANDDGTTRPYAWIVLNAAPQYP